MQRRARRSAQCEAEKGRASQKQRSEFLAAPFHKAPPGRQKSEREFCLFRGVFLRPMRRAMCRGGRSCTACRCYVGFWPGAPAFFLQARHARGEFFGTVCPACLLCAEGTGFFAAFFTRSPRKDLPFFFRCSAALFPACGSCHLLLFRGLLRPLPVCLFCVVYAGFLSLVFLPFPA